jgi:anti-sigma factor RsiW
VDPHLDANDLAGFIDGLLPSTEGRRVRAHLATCATCRAEYRAVRNVVAPGVQWRLAAGAGFAAAAVVVIALGLRPRSPAVDPAATRDGADSARAAPRIVEPAGRVHWTRVLRWSTVPNAMSYRVTIFDTLGTARWEAESEDSAGFVPDSVRLSPDEPFHWKVEAQTEWGRWVSSPLVEFTPVPDDAP